MKAYKKPEIEETELLCADVIATSKVKVSEQAYQVEEGETLTFATSKEIEINPFN